MAKKAQVIVVMGSDSDLPVVSDALKTLDEFKVLYDVRILSAHRCPEETHQLASEAYGRGVRVVIAAAGKSAHLAGVMAATFPLAVIGIPMKTSDLGGVDSLYSTVQMPSGVPVATVAINGAKNAAILAVQMLAVGDEKLAKKLMTYKKDMNKKVLEKSKRLKKVGYQNY